MIALENGSNVEDDGTPHPLKAQTLCPVQNQVFIIQGTPKTVCPYCHVGHMSLLDHVARLLLPGRGVCASNTQNEAFLEGRIAFAANALIPIMFDFLIPSARAVRIRSRGVWSRPLLHRARWTSDMHPLPGLPQALSSTLFTSVASQEVSPFYCTQVLWQPFRLNDKHGVTFFCLPKTALAYLSFCPSNRLCFFEHSLPCCCISRHRRKVAPIFSLDLNESSMYAHQSNFASML